MKKSAGGWVARCPAHEDRAQSLSITEKDGKVLAHCFTGCTFEAIAKAMQLTPADFFVEARAPSNGAPAGGRRLVATYDYQAADGTLLYQVVRFEPKDFRPRKPDGTWGLEGVRRVVYRLPELAEMRRVFLVEGEKDTDTLWAAGVPATTSPSGSQSWRDEYAEQLRDAGVDEVVILPDNDDAGLQYATKAAAALTAAGILARVLRLPGLAPKGDVSDWLAAGHTTAELEQLAAAAPKAGVGPIGVQPLGIGLGTFLTIVDPEIEPYIEGVLSADGGGWIGGEEKLGKSYYATDEALCISLGLDVCGKFKVPRRRRVLFLEEEDSPRRTRTRLRALVRGHGFDPTDVGIQAELNTWFHLEAWSGFTFDDEVMRARLEAAIVTFEPAIVYVDVLRKVTLRDLNKAEQAGLLLAQLDDLRRRYGVLFRILTHYRKSQGFRVGRGSQEIGGSFVLGAWAENSLFFEPMGRKQGAATKVEIQMKDGVPEPAFLLQMDSTGPRHAPTTMILSAKEHSDRNAGEDLRDKLVEAVNSLETEEARIGQRGVRVTALALAVGRPESTVRRTLKTLADKGVIAVVGQAGKKLDLYGPVKT